MNWVFDFWYFLVVFLIGVMANYYPTVPPPKLECNSDSIRLHINPSGNFGGHVYVRGFFPQSVCHLNYCHKLTNQPIIMDLSFRGPCNLRRRRSISPPSISYDVTVIIQHHPLFVTSFDKAYRLNCIYQQKDIDVQQKLDVNDIPQTDVKINSAPQCRYDVLSGSISGPIVKFANVGDIVYHKWTCDSEFFGFLVHSCVVRDDSGKIYQFIDERGCVTDSTLFPEVSYSVDLKSAFTNVRAFRYADQVMVHFTCQITTCRLSENGCEGISPPTCAPIEMGPIPVHYTKKEPKIAQEPETLPTRTTRSSSSTTSTTTQKSTSSSYSYPNTEPDDGSLQDNTVELPILKSPKFGLEISKDPEIDTDNIGLEISGEGFSIETLSKTLDIPLEPFPFPTKATIFQHRTPRGTFENSQNSNNFTIEVEAKQMLILEDDKDIQKSSVDLENSRILLILVVSQVLTIVALISQFLYYRRVYRK
ncbi:unnamed protein product [Caenorhabditis angaria]|uniref:ZP domain-containing protein n=1 Tax=Caenorhabditis angaria TaxID=860376 RepID=A0A9P1MUJ6_9PELO|nr:unnamed protein product [Caenorhabditis angaria]